MPLPKLQWFGPPGVFGRRELLVHGIRVVRRPAHGVERQRFIESIAQVFPRERSDLPRRLRDGHVAMVRPDPGLGCNVLQSYFSRWTSQPAAREFSSAHYGRAELRARRTTAHDTVVGTISVAPMPYDVKANSSVLL